MRSWAWTTGLAAVTADQPQLWRQFSNPLRQYVERIHARKFCFFHSDGYIFDIYEDLIEIGVDAVNSQLFCMTSRRSAVVEGPHHLLGRVDRQTCWLTAPSTTSAGRRRAANALYDGHGGVIASANSGWVRTGNVRAVFDEWDRLSAQAES